jgi:hypothetical protein
MREVLEVEGRLRKHDVDVFLSRDVEHRWSERGVGAGWYEVKRVTEMTADRAFRHVRADEANSAFSVLAQRAHEGHGPRRAARAHENRDRS